MLMTINKAVVIALSTVFSPLHAGPGILNTGDQAQDNIRIIPGL